MQHLFVYGTLLFPEIVQKLTGKVFETIPAVLFDFIRVQIVDCDYPAIRYKNPAKVEGLLLRNVDERSMKMLTFFEGEEYQPELVEVETKVGKLSVLTFVWKGNPELLGEENWSILNFKKESLKIYCEEIVPETVNVFKRFKSEG